MNAGSSLSLRFSLLSFRLYHPVEGSKQIAIGDAPKMTKDPVCYIDRGIKIWTWWIMVI